MNLRSSFALLPLLCLCLCLCLASPSLGDDLIVDGGFEAGTGDPPNNPNWTESSTNFGSPICERGNPELATCDPEPDIPAIAARSGTWFTWFGGLKAGQNGTSPEIGSVGQSVAIPPDGGGGTSSATLRFFVKNPVCSDDPDDALDALEVKVAGVVEYSTGVGDPSCGNPNYREEIVDLAPYIGQTVTLAFEGGFNGDKVTNILVDDVALYSCQYPANVVVANETITGTDTRRGCLTLTAGPAVVIADQAVVVFEAPLSVTLGDGFSVESGGQLTIRTASE
ncbi:MAG TPA: hypothetical protein VMT85_10395 [Thermoanaerobaculia bacterium]|nr:hypothetical protein [Thermoanaerobaculia bacterium]